MNPQVAAAPLVLVVEDDPLVANTLLRILDRQRYEVLLAVSAEEALLLFIEHKERLHVAIVDIKLPGMDGADLTLRFAEIDARVPVILNSGFGGDFNRAVFSSPNFRGFLAKPYKPADLITLVRGDKKP